MIEPLKEELVKVGVYLLLLMIFVLMAIYLRFFSK